MSKGIIFTADASIALGIFLASLFIFYSFFISDQPFGLRGAAIYTKTDNYLYIEEISEAFASVYNLYQSGNNNTAYMLLDLIRTQSEYPANMRLYVYEPNGSVSKIYDMSPNYFEDKLVFRRFAAYSITKGIPHSGTAINATAPTTLTGNTINVSVLVNNNAGAAANLVLQVYNATNIQMPWSVSPVSYTVNPGVTQTFYFNVTVPQGAWVDEYYVKAVTNSATLGNGTDPFNVVRFGMVEMEVGI